MNKIFLIFLIVISACRKHPDLKLSELKFPFPDKAAILTNLIDSTILVLEHKSQKDTIGLITYDEMGRTLFDASDQWAESYRYLYDTMGLVKSKVWRDWDVYLRFEASYEYFPDSLLLVQHWTGDYPYTTRFIFNSAGYLIEELTDDPGNTSGAIRSARTLYEYSDDHRLISRTKTSFRYDDLEEEQALSIFYTGKKIDSAITIGRSKWRGSNKTVDYYDTNGLKKLILIYRDSVVGPYRIGYIHKIRPQK